MASKTTRYHIESVSVEDKGTVSAARAFLPTRAVSAKGSLLLIDALPPPKLSSVMAAALLLTNGGGVTIGSINTIAAPSIASGRTLTDEEEALHCIFVV